MIIKFAAMCPECNQIQLIPVALQDYYNWKMGMTIQKAFPYLNADEREAFITGYCGVCWDVLFGFEDFEDEFANV